MKNSGQKLFFQKFLGRFLFHSIGGYKTLQRALYITLSETLQIILIVVDALGLIRSSLMNNFTYLRIISLELKKGKFCKSQYIHFQDRNTLNDPRKRQALWYLNRGGLFRCLIVCYKTLTER